MSLWARGETVFGEKLTRRKDKYLLLITTCITNPFMHWHTQIFYSTIREVHKLITHFGLGEARARLQSSFKSGLTRHRSSFSFLDPRNVGTSVKPAGMTDFPSAHGIVCFTFNPIIIYTWDGISQGELITRSILVMSVASTGQLCARKNRCEPSASNWCLSSLGGEGGLWKVYQPELVGCSNHSGLRLAIRSEGVSFSSVFFGVASQWVNECACANESNSFEFFFTSGEKRPSCFSDLLIWPSLCSACHFL